MYRFIVAENERIPKELLGKQQLPDMNALLDGVTMGKLEDIFHMVMKRQIDRVDPIRSKFGEIKREKIKQFKIFYSGVKKNSYSII